MLSSSSGAAGYVAPKVLPGSNNGDLRSELCGGALPPLMPFTDALYPLLQPVHYGPQDLMACTSCGGGACVIFVFDMNSVQLVQTLQGHSLPVTALAWKPPKLSYQQHRVFLLSGDQGGNVFLWDVAEGVVISRIDVPCSHPVQILSLLSDQHLLVMTNTGNGYVFNAHLIDTTVLPPAPLPLQCKEGPRPPVRLATSKLSPSRTSVLLMGDRARILSHLDPSRDSRPTARDLIYDSEAGEVTVVDAFFSEAAEEVLYFALPTAVGRYDWKVGMVLDEQLFWTRDGVQFLRIFPSSSAALDREDAQGGLESPLLYSFTTDQRFTAWYLQRNGKFTAVSTDVRGVRITSKAVATVAQAESDATSFAVLFEDGSIVKWRFSTRCRRWRLTHYYGCPIQRPSCFCRAGTSANVCCALETGHVVVVDARHSTPLKRLNLVYSGGTRIILLCPHRRDDGVWVVTNRVLDGRHHHQVSLLDVRSGEVVRVLRKPSSTAELTRAKEASMDPSGTYLLLSFWNGTFEVWNTEDGRLLHMHSGLGVACVSWAPANLRRCLTGVQGSPQLLSLVFSEGTMSLWSVYKDRCIVSRDAVPLLNPSTISGGTVQSAAVGHHLVVFDSTGVGFSISAKGTRLSSLRLKDIPPTLGAVRCMVSNDSPSPAVTSASFAGLNVFSQDDASGAAVSAASEDSARRGMSAPVMSCVAVVFDDFTFGVWNVVSGECLGMSTAPASAAALKDVTATQVLWLEDSVAVLGQGTGNVLVLDRRLSTLNSPVSARALRRPLQNPSFLLPAQRTFLQASLELALSTEDSDIRAVGANAAGSASAQEAKTSAPSSPLSSNVALSNRPCRGPFGQIVDDNVRSFEEEMALYQSTMFPRSLMTQLAAAHRHGDIARAAFLTAQWFGQKEKQRLWALVGQALTTLKEANGKGNHAPCSSRCSTQDLSDKRGPDGDAVKGLSPWLEPWEVQEPHRCDGADTDGERARPFFLADPFAVSCAPTRLVRANRLALCESRAAAVRRAQDPSLDDAKARLYTARDFLKLGEAAKAVDVLLECSYDNPKFNQLSTLATATAAGAAALAATGPAALAAHARADHTDARRSVTPPPPSQLPGSAAAQTAATALFTLSTKRAAAMLLAAGEVDAAVEKFVVAGEYNEACRALESQGRWFEAAALTKVSPLAPGARRAILERWAQQCARYDVTLSGLTSCRILVSQGLLWEALEALTASSQMTDVAGMLAVVLTQACIDSPALAEGVRCLLPLPPPSGVTTALLNVLADYSAMLASVGNRQGEARVLELAASLKQCAHQRLASNVPGEEERHRTPS